MKTNRFEKIITYIVITTFLWSNVVWAEGLIQQSSKLAPLTNLPVLYKDAAVDMIALDILQTLTSEEMYDIKIFYEKGLEEEIRRRNGNVRCFGIRDMRGKKGGWAFYIVDLDNNELIRYTSNSDVIDRFYNTLVTIERPSIIERYPYNLKGKRYVREEIPITPKILPFIKTCLSGIFTYPKKEDALGKVYKNTLGYDPDPRYSIEAYAEYYGLTLEEAKRDLDEFSVVGDVERKEIGDIVSEILSNREDMTFRRLTELFSSLNALIIRDGRIDLDMLNGLYAVLQKYIPNTKPWDEILREWPFFNLDIVVTRCVEDSGDLLDKVKSAIARNQEFMFYLFLSQPKPKEYNYIISVNREGELEFSEYTDRHYETFKEANAIEKLRELGFIGGDGILVIQPGVSFGDTNVGLIPGASVFLHTHRKDSSARPSSSDRDTWGRYSLSWFGKKLYPHIEVAIESLYPKKISWVKEHAKRVGRLAEIIARRMGFSDEFVRLVRIAALSHDLGKGDSEEMIEAVNSTSSQKAEIIDIHREEGIKVLEKAGVEVDDIVKQAILYHHEPWLVKDKTARVVAEIIYLADQIDASQDTHRPYKDRMRDSRMVLMEFRRDYREGKVSKRVYKSVYYLLTEGQKDFMDVIYEARGGVKWHEMHPVSEDGVSNLRGMGEVEGQQYEDLQFIDMQKVELNPEKRRFHAIRVPEEKSDKPIIYELCARSLGKRFSEINDEEIQSWAGRYNYIWMMGVWEESEFSTRYNKRFDEKREASSYAIPDYVINPLLGGEEEFRDFVQRCNNLGLKVIIDFVPNHMSADSPWIGEHPDWFMQAEPNTSVPEDPVRDDINPCYRTPSGHIIFHGRDTNFIRWGDTAQLNLTNEELRKHLIEILKKIAKITNGGGVRCDMVNLTLKNHIHACWFPNMSWEEFNRVMPQEFWIEAIQEVKKEYPDFIFVGEVYWEQEGYAQGLGFDYTYDKYMYELLQTGDITKLKRYLLGSIGKYLERSLHCIANHDEGGARSKFGEREFAAAMLIATLPGSLLLAEGQEEGFIEHSSANWIAKRTDEQPDPKYKEFYSNLLRIARDPVFREGDFKCIEAQIPPNIIAYRRRYNGKTVLVVTNYSGIQDACDISFPEIFGKTGESSFGLRDYLNPQRGLSEEEGFGHINLGPWETRIFELCEGTSILHIGDKKVLEERILALYPDEIRWVREHARRTARLAEIIASRMQLGTGLIRQIRIAALAHDLGKGSSSSMITAVNSAGPKEELIERHREKGINILKENGIPLNEILELAILYHHEPWRISADKNYPRIAADIIYLADQIDASQDTGRPYDGRMKDIRSLLKEIKSHYENGKATKGVCEAVKRLLTEAQTDFMEIIHDAWLGNLDMQNPLAHHPLIKEERGACGKTLFKITLDESGGIVETETVDSSEKSGLYNEQYIVDARNRLVADYGGTGILSGIRRAEIVDRDGPVGSQVDSNAEIGIDIFRDPNLVIEVWEYEAIHEILGLIIPDKSDLAQVVATWYSARRFVKLSDDEKRRMIDILRDKSNGLDPSGRHAEFLEYITRENIKQDDALIPLALAYLYIRGLGLEEIKKTARSFEETIRLFNDFQNLKNQIKETEGKMLKVIKTFNGVRIRGRIPERVRRLIGYIARNASLRGRSETTDEAISTGLLRCFAFRNDSLPLHLQQEGIDTEKMRYIVVAKDRKRHKLQIEDELTKYNIRIVTDINEVPKEAPVVIIVDPEDVGEWKGRRYSYLPLPYMEISLKLAVGMVLSDVSPRNFVKGFYEILLRRPLNDDEVSALFDGPWWIKREIDGLRGDLYFLREAIEQYGASA